jgi:hypothetical protein
MNRADLLLLWRRHRKAAIGFLLAASLTLFFLGRLVISGLYWAAHRDEPVQPWMTVGYIAHSWGLEARELDLRAGLPAPEKGHPFTLREIARQRGVSEAEIVALVEATVAAMRAETSGHKAPGAGD